MINNPWNRTIRPSHQDIILFKLIMLFILSTSIAYAMEDFGAVVDLAIFVSLFVVLLTMIILGLALKKYIWVYISLFVIWFGFFVNFNFTPRSNFKIWSSHWFQTPNTYGVYEGNQTVPGTENLNIIYMSYPYLTFPDLLDDNNTVYLFESGVLKHKIHVKELDKVTFFEKADKILMFAHRGENNGSFVAYSPIKEKLSEYESRMTDYAYDEKSTNYYLDRFIFVPRDYKSTVRTYEKAEFNDTQKLQKEFIFHEPIVLIDKKNKQLRLYERRYAERFRPFSVPYTPRMAVYDEGYDKIFVVYEEVKGVHILENANKKEYEYIQTMVKNLIDTSRKTPEKLSDLKIHSLNSKQLEKLHDTLIVKPEVIYRYKIKVFHDQASVSISSDSKPLLHVTFLLTKKEQWIISDVIYEDPERLNILGS